MTIIGTMLDRLLPKPVEQSVMKIFDADACFPAGSAGTIIGRNEMYFEIRLNQMSLARNVEWFKVFDPLVVVTVGFNYGNEPVEIPVILGPGSIQKHLATGAPLFGTVLTNVSVTGPHPYLGPGLKLSVAFYRVLRKSYTTALIKMIERLSSIIGMDQIGTFANTAGAIVDGLQGLLGGDAGDTVCLAAHQFSMPMSPYPLETSCIALIMPPVPADLGKLSVKAGQLFESTAQHGDQPFAGADFVLLSVAGMQRRQNENLFPAYQLKRQALQAVGEGEPSRKRAKALLLSALQQLRASKDFTKVESDLLFEEWLKEFTAEASLYDKNNILGPNDAPRTLPTASGELNDAIARLAL